MDIILEDIDKLIPYARNPRKNQAIDKVAVSIREFGFRQPIVVDKNLTIIAGHTRYEASKKLGLKKVPIHIAKELTPAQVKAYRIADNRVAQDSEWDIGLLNYEFTDLLNENYDLELLGFDNKELEDLIVDKPQGLTDDDFVPDIPEKPKSKLGEIYQLGHHRLMCGDATKEEDINKLMDGTKADMVFTDPPYGMNLETDYSNMGSTTTTYKPVINDDKPFDGGAMMQLLDSPIWYIWGADYFCNSIPNWTDGSVIVWAKAHSEKENAVFGSSFEICWRYPKRKKDIWFVRRIQMTSEHLKEHPTQKPTDLALRAIESDTKTGQLIVDLYLGSGSTLIAAEKKNRKCYGMELDPIYVDVIIKRWEQWTGEKAELVKQ